MKRIYVLPFVIAILTIASCDKKQQEHPCSCTHAPQLTPKPIPQHVVCKPISFIQKQRPVTYLKVVNAIGKMLAHPRRDSKFVKNFEAYKVLYYGEALLVSDSAVNMAMHTFWLTAKDYYAGDMFTKETTLKDIGMATVLCIRKELEK